MFASFARLRKSIPPIVNGEEEEEALLFVLGRLFILAVFSLSRELLPDGTLIVPGRGLREEEEEGEEVGTEERTEDFDTLIFLAKGMEPEEDLAICKGIGVPPVGDCFIPQSFAMVNTLLVTGAVPDEFNFVFALVDDDDDEGEEDEGVELDRGGGGG